jgi:hypothetical protein
VIGEIGEVAGAVIERTANDEQGVVSGRLGGLSRTLLAAANLFRGDGRDLFEIGGFVVRSG